MFKHKRVAIGKGGMEVEGFGFKQTAMLLNTFAGAVLGLEEESESESSIGFKIPSESAEDCSDSV